MVKHEMFVVFDRASAVYAGPFLHQTIKVAERWFMDVCSNKDNQIAQHPDDFTLMHVGSFNDGTAQFESKAPEKVVNGVEAMAELSKVVSIKEKASG